MCLYRFAKCGFLLAFLCLPLPRQQAPLPQRRNGVAGHGSAGGAVADVAEYGRGVSPARAGGRGPGAGDRRGPRRAPRRVPRLPPGGTDGGAGWPPSWGGRRAPPWPTLADAGEDGPWSRAHGMGLARTTFGSNRPTEQSQHRSRSRSVARDT